MRNESLPLSFVARFSGLSLAIALSLGFVQPTSPALAKDKPAAEKKDAKDKTAAEDSADSKKSKSGGKTDKAEKSGGGGKPEQLDKFGDWGAYLAQGGGRDKTCYALGQPKDRQPKAKLKDTSAYVFISSRPAEGVRNEVAINLGYATKDGSAAIAQIDGDEWDLITKGTNAWVKEQSKEKEFVGALRGGSKLLVKASSSKGTTTVDTYVLKGLSDALARVAQECK